MARAKTPAWVWVLIAVPAGLVVLGLLAAIVIPVALNQVAAKHDTEAKADLHNLAASEETYLTDHGSYGSVTELRMTGQPVRVAPTDVLHVVWFDGANGYCLSAKSQLSPRTFYYDSEAGGLQPAAAAGCPTLPPVTATFGDSVTG